MKLSQLLEVAPTEQHGPTWAGAMSMTEIVEDYLVDFTDWPIEQPLGRYIEGADVQLGIIPGRTSGVRRSVGGTGVVQRLLFDQPSWASLPNRAISTFATTTIGKGTFADMASQSSSYSLYMVIPKNGAKCAMVEDDFNSIRYDGERLQSVIGGNIIYKLETYCDWLPSNIRARLPTEMHTARDVQKTLDVLLQHGDPEAIHFIETRLKPFKKMVEEASHDGLPPESFGITQFTPENYRRPASPHEVWFTGEYIQIPSDQYEKFVKTVRDAA